MVAMMAEKRVYMMAAQLVISTVASSVEMKVDLMALKKVV